MGIALDDMTWRRISNSVIRINSAKTLADMCQESLSCICRMIPVFQGLISIVKQDGAKRSYSDMYFVGEPPRSWNDVYIDEGLAAEPRIQDLELKLTNSIYRWTDLYSEEERRNRPITKRLLEPMGIEFGLHAILNNEHGELGEINLYRTLPEGDFTDREIEILEIFSGHITPRLAVLIENSEGRSNLMVNQKIPDEDLTTFEKLLTRREYQILLLASEGLKNDEIAQRLHLSSATVKKHVQNGYKKLGISSRTQLVHRLHMQRR